MSLLTNIDDRSREVFRLVVESYLETGDPVGSRTLSHSKALALSPATIRNVMADLTDMGLLHAPHISAGRMPTDQGLRLFVDGLLEIGSLNEEERCALEEEMKDKVDLDTALSDAARRLAGLTQTASLVLTGKTDRPLKHIEVVSISPERALLVLVSSTGEVENRVIALPKGLPASALTEASNYLNAQLQGRTLAEARADIEREMASARASLDKLTQELVRRGVAALSQGGDNLIVRGQAHLLDNTTTEDIELVRLLFQDLERKKDVIELLQSAKSGEGVRVFIGSENPLFSLSGSSLILTPYKDKSKQIVGVVGVIGPTRLNYARVIPLVNYTAEIVTKLL